MKLLRQRNLRVDHNVEQLRDWAKEMDQIRHLAAEFIQSNAFHDQIISGVALNASVNESSAGITYALREAASELAVDGWTPVASVGRWIAERHSDQLPAKYGCSSWRQVVHESRLFELRYREVNGRRMAWYRTKQM